MSQESRRDGGGCQRVCWVERCKDGTLTPIGEKPLGDFDQKTNIFPLHV